MALHHENVEPEVSSDRIAQVETIDFSMLITKLALKGRSTRSIEHAVERYKNFLKLHLLHPDASLVPTEEIDEIWHAHILDTARYRTDCDRIFGAYLDHYPYFGLRGEADAQALDTAFATTCSLYHAEFGEELSSGGGACVRRSPDSTPSAARTTVKVASVCGRRDPQTAPQPAHKASCT